VGTFTLTPSVASPAPEQHVTFNLNWTTPPPDVWRDLKTTDVRFRDGGDIALWLRWDQAANTFSVVDPDQRLIGPAKVVGSNAVLETSNATVYLSGSSIHGSGPTGPSVAMNIEASFKPRSAGHNLTVEVSAENDAGVVDDFVTAGSVSVGQRH